MRTFLCDYITYLLGWHADSEWLKSLFLRNPDIQLQGELTQLAVQASLWGEPAKLTVLESHTEP